MHRSRRTERMLDTMVLGGLLIAGSFLARKAADETWHLVSDDPPPDPDDPDESLTDVLIWSLLSGLLLGLTRLLVRRKFAPRGRSLVRKGAAAVR